MSVDESSRVLPSPWPLVGRRRELARLCSILDRPERSSHRVVFLAGESGVGKTRLAEAAAEQAREEGWNVVTGRSYPVETGVPYALFGDAFLPLLTSMDPETLTVLSRGGERELAYLFPSLRRPGAEPDPFRGAEPGEFKTRLLWNFNQFLEGLAGRQPLFVVLDDVQWADQSSLELLHFVARQRDLENVAIIATYNETERDPAARLGRVERSLASLGVATHLHLEPLSLEATLELLRRAFETDTQVVREFGAALYGWTRGNPFFLEEVLKELVESGRLHRRDGTWLGWGVRELGLPRSLRDAVLARVAALSEEAREIARTSALMGSRIRYGLLRAVVGLTETELLDALAELRRRRVLAEREGDPAPSYEFVHPLVGRTLYAEIGAAEAQRLHGHLAVTLEEHFGDEATDHADELAYHFARSSRPDLASKAVVYLAAAGRHALERHADIEAAGYLEAALERRRHAEEARPGHSEPELRRDLGRALARRGRYANAVANWNACLEATRSEDYASRAELQRYIGLSCFFAGDVDEARSHLDEALATASRAGDRAEARVRVLRGFVHQELGNPEDARVEYEAVGRIAERLSDPALAVRAKRSLALLHLWISPRDEALERLAEALEAALDVGDDNSAFWCRWGLAALTGLTGDLEGMVRYVEAARADAERMRAPVLELWVEELAIERAFADGEWERGVAMADAAVATSRDLHQRILLTRFLVLSALFAVGRGQLERAKELVDEACELAGVGSDSTVESVHRIVPAHIGLAAYHLASGDHEEAIRVGERALSIADGTGYTLLALHRLIPILTEAYLWIDNLEGAERLAERMRRHSARLDHRLADAWAGACDALVCWKRGDSRRGAELIRAAAETLESIPMIPAATRLRRQLAGRLAEIGEPEQSYEELRRVHDVFQHMGAETELERARIQFREIGRRPPPRVRPGESPLTPRELQVARLVSGGRSSKSVAKELGIAWRTVDKHVANAFAKLGLRSRIELAAHLRDHGLLEA